MQTHKQKRNEAQSYLSRTVKELGNCLLHFQCSQTDAALDTYFLKVFNVAGSYFETDSITHTLENSWRWSDR